jgi:hypothetical protein
MRPPEPAPAGLRAPASGRVRHPEAAPAPAELPQATGDRARALVWAGLGVVALVLFGGTLMRANAAVNRRVVALVATARRLGPSPAWFWALRHPKPPTDR